MRPVQFLRVRLLGELQVEGCDGTRLGRRQGRRLLKVLALHHARPVTVDHLVSCVWGQDAPTRASDQVSVLVSRLRAVLGGAAFTFAHALVREALASTVGPSRAAFLHREAGRALGARADADPLAVAHHARLGGDLHQAGAMLVAGARVAVARFHQEEACHLLDEAITLDDTAEARVERARVHSLLGRYAEAAADLDAGVALGAGPEALEVAAWSAHLERRFAQSLVLADRGAREATAADVRTSCLALGGWVSLAAGDLAGSDARLGEALATAPLTIGRLAEAWLAWLRVSQGRPEEALRLARPETGRGLAAYRFPNAYGLMAATMASATSATLGHPRPPSATLGHPRPPSATLGRPDEALATLATLADDVARMGARRWTPRPLNLRGWIVRNLGGLGEADELNHAATELAAKEGLTEPLAQGVLDLAAGRLLAGDLDGAAGLLVRADGLGDVEHAFRWRHQLRGRLLRARLDLAGGDLQAALLGAAALATDAGHLGIPHYRSQALLVGAVAARRRGRARTDPAGALDMAPHLVLAGDLDAVGALLDGLDQLAGLEAWWITAEVATTFDVPVWQSQARRRVARLVGRAGSYADGLERFAARRLG